jgi:dihydroneopterin aldolase
MTIYIENLKFQCIIGILDLERVKPQDVIVNVKITYEYKDEFINYADLSEFIKSRMKDKQFLLIEDALEDLSINLKNKFSKINTLDLKITKPSILSDCDVSVATFKNFNS